jgi:hypothetical protein
MSGTRIEEILAALEVDEDPFPARLCRVTTEIMGVKGASVMIMAGDVPQGSLCTTNNVSNLIEELQFTLGEGPCVDAYQTNEAVFEPDLANPVTPRWHAFTPRVVEAGVRALFSFPLREGTVRLGSLNLYEDRVGGLSDDQKADGLLMADVIARWVLDAQIAAPPNAFAAELRSGADFHFIVHNAAGIVSVQLATTVTEALIRIRAHAFSEDRPVRDVAEDIVARRLRFS